MLSKLYFVFLVMIRIVVLIAKGQNLPNPFDRTQERCFQINVRQPCLLDHMLSVLVHIRHDFRLRIGDRRYRGRFLHRRIRIGFTRSTKVSLMNFHHHILIVISNLPYLILSNRIRGRQRNRVVAQPHGALLRSVGRQIGAVLL